VKIVEFGEFRNVGPQIGRPGKVGQGGPDSGIAALVPGDVEARSRPGRVPGQSLGERRLLLTTRATRPVAPLPHFSLTSPDRAEFL
jgi:hypothetical protein